MNPIYTPDRGIVEQLRRIDRDLSVAWVETPRGGRWAVYHALQVPGDVEASIDLVARALQGDAAARGYVFDLADCAWEAREAVQGAKLVCYVAEDDGAFRPLDDRLVKKFERMDYHRRNLDIRGWREMLQAKADVARAQRERDQSDVWDCIRRDPVFARQASDLLWGMRPVRSVVVEETIHGTHAGERAGQAAAGEAPGTSAASGREHRGRVPLSVGGAAGSGHAGAE